MIERQCMCDRPTRRAADNRNLRNQKRRNSVIHHFAPRYDYGLEIPSGTNLNAAANGMAMQVYKSKCSLTNMYAEVNGPSRVLCRQRTPKATIGCPAQPAMLRNGYGICGLHVDQ